MDGVGVGRREAAAVGFVLVFKVSTDMLWFRPIQLAAKNCAATLTDLPASYGGMGRRKHSKSLKQRD